MLRALAVLVALGSSAAIADDCPYVSDQRSLFFVDHSSVVVVIDRNYRDLPYVCTTATLGTGISGRMLHCSDGYSGAMMFPEDGIAVTFRDADWTDTCPDNTPMDISLGN